METDGGGWTVFQRRKDGSVEFYQNWADYVHGFGNPSGEYWLGLSKIHRLANRTSPAQLRVDLRDKDGNTAYASYSTFFIGSSITEYYLHVSGYSGTAGNSFKHHNLMRFTTKDNDNDIANGKNCAQDHHGAWWYSNCQDSNLNGPYGNDDYTKGMNWHSWKGYKYSIPFTEMKIRRL